MGSAKLERRRARLDAIFVEERKLRKAILEAELRLIQLEEEKRTLRGSIMHEESVIARSTRARLNKSEGQE